MTMTESANDSAAVPPSPAPIRWWSMLGAVGLATQAVVLGRWLADGSWRLTNRPVSPPHLGDPALTTAFTLCYAPVVVALAVWVVRGCWRERRLTFAALVMLTAPLGMWLDLVGAWLRPVFAYYKDDPLAIRSWFPALPGWRGGDQPATNLPPQALLAYLSMPLFFLIMRQAMRLTAGRWPHAGRRRLAAAALAAGVVCGAGVMITGVVVRMFAFVDTIPALTLFYGSRFQYPAYDAVFLGASFAVFGMLWYHQDSDGLTAIERGADRFRPWARPWLRLLAMAGAIQLAVGCYGLTHLLASLAASPAPPALVTPVLSTWALS